ncbi:hypothetical protein HPB49_012417 [Dermacentor silvarum]|uniref:Uncharacterized protein n=1 Tax=Dermacentor silvarum TaxID=543639 RepID=A0ACB8CXD5_DERSI|nr:hypothetical protein HPB49_012417 [Dermacentor silvarum]
MTDNSRPEKDALKKTWPTAEQLLCQFHVLQAEWRWLTATANKVPKEDRRQLMAAFQKILYAKDLSQLQAAKEHLRTVGHEAYIHRVEAFLCCEKEWVQMYRTNLATRGHNTNNYSEASIRILKDVVLCRTKAFNAVALVEIVVSTWEKYFETRLLRHAHHREASHRLTFEHLLQDLPELPAGSITKSGETYYVPSSSSTATHEVQADVGICSCLGRSLSASDQKRYSEKLFVYGVQCPDPYGIPESDWIKDADAKRLCPPVKMTNVVIYLLFSPSQFTPESVENYKSLEAYRPGKQPRKLAAEPKHTCESFNSSDKEIFERLQKASSSAVVVRSIPKLDPEDTDSASEDEEMYTFLWRAPLWGTVTTFLSRHAGGPANPYLAYDDTDPLRRRVSRTLA